VTIFLLSGGVGVVNLAVSACVLRTMTKTSSTFFRKKIHPQRKSWLRLWLCFLLLCICFLGCYEYRCWYMQSIGW